jgi:membrane protease YdiL (CAAX protease family)
MITRAHTVHAILVPAAILLGCIALAARPPATVSAVLVVVAVGAIGALAPLPVRPHIRPKSPSLPAVVALGVLTFLVARVTAAPLPTPVVPLTVGATIVAAVAEELFFRRLVYGWLAPAGDALAIGGAAALFAVVHIPAYGLRALPVDLAAGALFGWQRWATGGWIAPALTHAAANVLQLF